MDTKAPTPPPSSDGRFLRGRRSPVAARRQAWAFREAGGSRPTCRGHPVAAMNARPTGSRVASTGFAFIGGHGSARDQRRRRRTRMPRQSAIARDLRPIGACVANRDPPSSSSAGVDARPGRTPGAADLQTGQSAIATDVRPTRSRVASKGFAFSRKSAMYSRGSGAACGSSTLSGSRWTPRTRNS